MRKCFFSIDVESDFAKKESFQGVENLDKVLKILQKHNIPATLFVTGRVLEKYPDRVKEWAKDYEISCHGFSHQFWSELSFEEREKEIDDFLSLYQKIFNKNPVGFRAPSHLIDEQGLKILEDKGFLYDSSVLPHYPVFKSPYRGYKGRAPLIPYFPDISNCRREGEMKILEIPVSGLLFGVSLVGTWILKLPLFFYELLILIKSPAFLTFNLHSWDSLNEKILGKINKILTILKGKNYQFLKGYQIYTKVHESLS